MGASEPGTRVRKTWADLAAYWDGKQGDTGDLWHRSLIDPPLVALVGDVQGKQVLDLGCGNGYLARRFAGQGAHVTGVDASGPTVDRARAREALDPLHIVYHVADAGRLTMLRTATFDVVYANMALQDIPNAEAALGEVGRVLRAGGRFVASLSHPCFDVDTESAWVAERTGPGVRVWRKIRRYREPHDDWFPWRVGDEVWLTQGFHRPLGWYVRTLASAGLAVTALEEPAPTAEFMAHDLEGPWIQEVPLHCVIGAEKVR